MSVFSSINLRCGSPSAAALYALDQQLVSMCLSVTLLGLAGSLSSDAQPTKSALSRLCRKVVISTCPIAACSYVCSTIQPPLASSTRQEFELWHKYKQVQLLDMERRCMLTAVWSLQIKCHTSLVVCKVYVAAGVLTSVGGMVSIGRHVCHVTT